MFYLEMNLCRKCPVLCTSVDIYQIYMVSGVGRGSGSLKLDSQQRLGFDVVRVSLLGLKIRNRSLICEITPV